MADFVTRQQVTEQTGVPRNTLLRWIRRELLPRLSIQTAPGGRGQQGVWPAHILERVRRIRDLQSKSFTLDAIAAALAAERMADLAVESVQAGIERFRELRGLADEEIQIGEHRATRRDFFISAIAAEVSEDRRSDAIRFLRERGNILEEAWRSHEVGSPLLLVVRPAEIGLIQAWRVSEMFSHPEAFPNERAAAQVIPLYRAFVMLSNATRGPMPCADRHISPTDYLDIREGGAQRRVRYRLIVGRPDQWTAESVRFDNVGEEQTQPPKKSKKKRGGSR